MAEESKIAWTDNTFNPFMGCQRVSPGCENCYAESQANRFPEKLGKWGSFNAGGTRIVTGERYWGRPKIWNDKAAAKLAAWAKHARTFRDPDVSAAEAWRQQYAEEPPERPRVFCASIADVFEAWPGPMLDNHGEPLHMPHDSWNERRPFVPFSACAGDEPPVTMRHVRDRLFRMIEQTPALVWQLVTKRPENVMGMVPESWRAGFPENVWMGTTTENQEYFDRRVPILRTIPAATRFLSYEPALGPLDMSEWIDVTTDVEHNGDGDTQEIEGPQPFQWFITGGESGDAARPFNLAWARSARDQCKASGVAFFMKQVGADPFEENMFEADAAGRAVPLSLPLIADRKSGAAPEDWPADLRVREFPQ